MNELTISPSGVPSTSAVTNATPVAKRPTRGARRGSRCAAISAGHLAAERDVDEELVRAVARERVHEAAGPHVAVRARQRVAVEVAGAARGRQRAVDDPRRRLVDERLRRLRLGEQAHEVVLVALVDQRGGSGEHRAARAELDRVGGDQPVRARVRRVALGDAGGGRGGRALGDAERRRRVEQPGHEVAIHVGLGVAGEKAAAQRARLDLGGGEGDGVAAGRAHAERVPVALDLDAAGLRRHLGVPVAFGALVVDERDRGEKHGRGGRHRAERLAAVDAPAGRGADGGRLRAREVLADLADRGRHDDAVVGDRRHRVAERGGPPRVAGPHRGLPAADDVHQDGEMHVHADRDRGVAAREPARGDQQVVHGGHAEAAVLDRDRRREVARALEGVEARERERGLAVVLRGARRHVLGQPLGKRDEAGTALRLGGELEHGDAGASFR